MQSSREKQWPGCAVDDKNLTWRDLGRLICEDAGWDSCPRTSPRRQLKKEPGDDWGFELAWSASSTCAGSNQAPSLFSAYPTEVQPSPSQILASVNDAGDFWETRSLERLTKEIGEQSAMLAGLLGALKDAIGQAPGAGTVEAPIAAYPNFEHLEAEGQRLLPEQLKTMLKALAQ